MKKILLLLTVYVSTYSFSQDIQSTNSFLISGEVENEVTIHITDLNRYAVHSLPDGVITNHLGEKKSEYKNVKGVLLKEVLDTVKIKAKSPKVLSEFYFKCIASDGYTVVYSWNELYNTETGNNSFLIAEKDGKKINEIDGSILMLCNTDFKTGRRYVKRLSKIEILK